MNKRFIVLLFFLFLFGKGFSQEQNTVSLEEVMRTIEDKFEVRFTYVVRDIRGIEIQPPHKDLDLQGNLDYLNRAIPLLFKLVDERFISVSKVGKTISICGKLIDSSNDEPLLGASIQIIGENTGTISNMQGEFSLDEVPLNSRVEISFLGFSSEFFQASDLFAPKGNCKLIILTENVEQLNEIIISKFLTSGLQSKLDGTIVLNTEEFGILPGLIEPDILQTIQALPGVESSDESIANLNVRGGNNDENLMLWDGIKMYHSGHFFGLISAYNPYLTNKVQVIKNGTSAAYSDGVSSTVIMETDDELSDKISANAGFNLISADAVLKVPIGDKFNLHVSGRRSLTDQFTTPTYDNYFERSFQDSEINSSEDFSGMGRVNSEFKFYDVSAKLLFDLNENQKFRLTAIGIINDLNYSESIPQGDSEEPFAKTSGLTQENIGAVFNWNADWSDKWSSEFLAYYSSYEVGSEEYRVNTDQRLTQGNEVLETGLKARFNHSINTNLSLNFGYQLNETGILNETTVSAPSYERTKKDVLINHAAFTELEYQRGTTYIRAGVRANYFDKFGKLIIEPRLNFRQKIWSPFSYILRGEFKNQSASQVVDFQDDFLGVENRRWVLSNERNRPIVTSRQVSSGFEFSKNRLMLQLTGFYKIVDGITASNQGFNNNFQFISAIGSYESKGVEFLLNRTADKWSAWASYTYSINDYTFESLQPSEFPNNNDIRHSISAAASINIFPDLEISFGGIWRTGIPFSKPLEGQETVQQGDFFFVNYDDPNSERLDEFIRLDASLHYEFDFSPSTRGILRAGVINLTNRENVITRYYRVDPNDQSGAIEISNNSLGITPNFSFRIRF